MIIKPSSKVLLLGAGFSHNFGAPLATEVWDKIFNLKSGNTQRLRKDMLNDQNCNFEDFYFKVITGDYTDEEKHIIQDAIKKVFLEIDNMLVGWTNNNGSQNALDIYALQRFISLFTQENGYIFTLNQDLLLERELYNYARPDLPGIKTHQWFFTPSHGYLEDNDYCQLPNQQEVDLLRSSTLFQSGFHYLKLHGSQNWLDSAGKQMLVIGRNKEEAITNEPLLNLYFDVFKDVLSHGNIELFIIGYGFKDEHINKAIVGGINNGLTIHTLAPCTQKTLKEEITASDKLRSSAIIGALMGHYACTLNQLFPADQSSTGYWSEIRENYFRGNALKSL